MSIFFSVNKLAFPLITYTRFLFLLSDPLVQPIFYAFTDNDSGFVWYRLTSSNCGYLVCLEPLSQDTRFYIRYTGPLEYTDNRAGNANVRTFRVSETLYKAILDFQNSNSSA